VEHSVSAHHLDHHITIIGDLIHRKTSVVFQGLFSIMFHRPRRSRLGNHYPPQKDQQDKKSWSLFIALCTHEKNTQKKIFMGCHSEIQKF